MLGWGGQYMTEETASTSCVERDVNHFRDRCVRSDGGSVQAHARMLGAYLRDSQMIGGAVELQLAREKAARATAEAAARALKNQQVPLLPPNPSLSFDARPSAMEAAGGGSRGGNQAAQAVPVVCFALARPVNSRNVDHQT